MNANPVPARAGMPAPFFNALLWCGAFMAFTAWDQSHWWRTKEDYSFGWLAPLFVGLILYDRWPRMVAAVSVRTESAAGSNRWFLWAGLLGGALLFLFGAAYRASAGPSYPGSLALAAGTAVITLGLTAMSVGGEVSNWRQVAGLMVFPACVWLVSAPLVSVVENALSVFLLSKVMSLVFFIFEILGMPLEQQGNVLVLPTGQVGVAEACSGIRSLTSCVFAGSFLAAMFLDRGWKKIVLVVASLGLAFAGNLLRSLFLTGYAYRHGPEAIAGRVHDLAGYAVMPVVVVGLLGFIALLKVKIIFSRR